MYIYHFWPLSMHCQKTTTIRCFLEATYVLLVVLRKPWICTLCFDAHFSKFRDFWWFWTIFNRKMNILDHFWGPQTASSPKVTIYLPLTPRTLSGPLFWTQNEVKSGQNSQNLRSRAWVWEAPSSSSNPKAARAWPSRSLLSGPSKGVQNGQN